MRRTLFVANLFLMLMLIFALQAQNHNNYGQNNQHQNNYSNHNQQNQHNQPQIREFTGVLARNNNNNHNSNWSNHPSGNQNSAYGILVQAPNNQTRFLSLDDKGNRIVRDILRNQKRNNKKIVVKVKGYQDRNGTLNVVSMSRINKPNRFFANFNNNNHGNWNNNGWSFQLFVGLN